MNNCRRYITTKELAARTGLSIRYFQNLAKRVPFASQPEPGGAILFDFDAYEAWLAAGRPKARTRGFRWEQPAPRRFLQPPDGEQSLTDRLRAMRAELNVQMKKEKR